MFHIGAQLYTVRELLSTDCQMKDTLSRIKAMGYREVQLFGSVEQIQKHAPFAKAAGLDIVGVLTDLDTCERDGAALFEICRAYHIGDIGVSSRFADCREIDSYIARINAFATKAKAEGFTFSYHNHGHEFIRLGEGDTAMNRFLKAFHTGTVAFMPDTYWLQDGGYDIRRFLEQTKNRVKILHLKDMKRTKEGHTFAELGQGNLYFKGIMETALACGITYFVVEQDVCEKNPLESLRQSYDYISALWEDATWNGCF